MFYFVFVFVIFSPLSATFKSRDNKRMQTTEKKEESELEKSEEEMSEERRKDFFF